MNKLLPVATIAALSLFARATETEHYDLRLLPAPGHVDIDGETGDWDLSGAILVCSDVENYRDQFASWQSMMYDADNLYILARWNDSTPLNNPGLCGSDFGFAGDCMQFRIVTDSTGSAGSSEQQTECCSHVDAWRGRDGRDVVSIQHGRQFNQGGVPNAKELGAKQAFKVREDGKGYTQEISIPWKLLCPEGYTPKAGDSIIITLEPNFGTASKLRITTKDGFRKGVTPDRVFAFMASQCWAPVKLLDAAPEKTIPVRLADGRTFPTHLGEDGAMVVDWNGLIKSDKPEGFIKVAFDMPFDGYASIIIRDKATGRVVRNLFNAGFLAAGAQEILWDGLTTPSDRRPGNPVAEGEYVWEAIARKGLDLTLVGWADNAGIAPFDCPGGNWGGDQGSPVDVDCDGDSVYLGWHQAEAGQSLVCADLSGKVKWRHKRGGFGNARLVAAADGTVFVYDMNQGNEIFLLDSAKGEFKNIEGSDATCFKVPAVLAQFAPPSFDAFKFFANGMAVKDGRLYVSWDPAAEVKGAKGGVIAVLDAKTCKVIGSIKLDAPRAVKRGADGAIYAIDGDSVVVIDEAALSAKPVAQIAGGKAVTADKDGNIYVAMGDPSNDIRVFSANGEALRTIGRAGGRPYDGPWVADGMCFIEGIQISSDGKLWVAENDNFPRRFVKWDAATGALDREYFGPTDYGALGGAICPTDPTIMVGMGCEWKIDTDTGHAECLATINRDCGWGNARFGQSPDGRVFLAVTGWWLDRMQDICFFERLGPGKWAFRAKVARMFNDPSNSGSGIAGARVWSDKNGDGAEQDDEVNEYRIDLGGWLNRWYMPMNQSLAFVAGRYVVAPTGWTECGAPEFDFTKYEQLNIDTAVREDLARRGGFLSHDGRYVIFNAPYGVDHGDSPCYDLESGAFLFSYPNNYVGVHGGHNAPSGRQGLIRAAYDFVGTVKMPAPLGNLFFIGTDKGEWHILNDRGFYVGRLFEGDPMRVKWPEEAIPGVKLNDTPPGMGAEDFGGSIIQTTDGEVYVQCGKTAFINAHLEGLETAVEIPGGEIAFGPDETIQANMFKAKYLSVGESLKTAQIPVKPVAFTGDPRRDFGGEGIAYGPDNARVSSWAATDGDRLILAWQVADATPWVNGASSFESAYAKGDTVDFQLGLDPEADPKRGEAVKGDLRLSIAPVAGKDTAILYRRVSDEKAPQTFYSGVWSGGYTMEYVRPIEGAEITVTKSPTGYVLEAAIPMAALGLAPKAGLELKGDFGATFGDAAGQDTVLRTYWANQATGIVADEVAELMLQPALWGTLVFE